MLDDLLVTFHKGLLLQTTTDPGSGTNDKDRKYKKARLGLSSVGALSMHAFFG
jgi:hypothetical protein